jgi:type IV secretory pathway VirB4 component
MLCARPLSFYLQQRFDECWRWMLLSDMGSYMFEKLKTGRKNNLGNIFATQGGLDAERAG